MARYRLLQPLTFGPGYVLGLSEAQALRRAPTRVLEPAGDGLYRSLANVQFKAGEEVAVSDLPRAFADKVVPLDEPVQAPAAIKRSKRR